MPSESLCTSSWAGFRCHGSCVFHSVCLSNGVVGVQNCCSRLVFVYRALVTVNLLMAWCVCPNLLVDKHFLVLVGKLFSPLIEE